MNFSFRYTSYRDFKNLGGIDFACHAGRNGFAEHPELIAPSQQFDTNLKAALALFRNVVIQVSGKNSVRSQGNNALTQRIHAVFVCLSDVVFDVPVERRTDIDKFQNFTFHLI